MYIHIHTYICIHKNGYIPVNLNMYMHIDSRVVATLHPTPLSLTTPMVWLRLVDSLKL